MTTDVKPDSRSRLLEAAATLTYRHGVVIGIEALCQAAGVSKRSLYQLFRSKDELLAAALEQRSSSYVARLLPPDDDARTHRERIRHVFEQLEAMAAEPDFNGCRYLSAQIELKDPQHPARQVAARVKGDLAGFFRDEAAQAGAADPDLLSRQLILVFDGASARAGIGVDSLPGLVGPTVETLLDAAGAA